MTHMKSLTVLFAEIEGTEAVKVTPAVTPAVHL